MPARSAITVTLRKDLRRALRSGHPWVFRDALAPFSAEPGEVVTVRDRSGAFVGRGLAEAGPIAVRLWTTVDEPIDARFVDRRVAVALELRARLAPRDTDALRWLHGEGDRLGGVVCDRYGEHAVLRFDGQAALEWRPAILAALTKHASRLGAPLAGMLSRRDRRSGEEAETVHGVVPDGPIEVHEHGMRLFVDPRRGHKTGMFLDHRDVRLLVRQIARGISVLDLYGYTGAFSVAAGLGGAASVDTVDVSAPALSLAERAWAHNGLEPGRQRIVAEDVPRFLERARAERRRWDLVIADPPSFAPNKGALAAALESYTSLHHACLGCVAEGGLYLAASCSSHVDRAAFEETLRRGAAKAWRVLQVLGRHGAGFDHPRLLAFPEGDYLKVTLCRAGR